jgi:hypothetical protein
MNYGILVISVPFKFKFLVSEIINCSLEVQFKKQKLPIIMPVYSKML